MSSARKPGPATVDATALRDLITVGPGPPVLDVRTPARSEAAHLDDEVAQLRDSTRTTMDRR